MITVENLTKTFVARGREVRALDGVNLAVPESAIWGVLGAAGAGKSTLAACVTLRERPDCGSVRVDGTDVLATGRPAEAQRAIGLVPRQATLHRERTVAGNVALPLERAGVAAPRRRVRVAQLLDVVGLTGGASAGVERLGAGARQRLAVARALATGPSLLVVDDPTAGMDAGAAHGVLTALDRARAELGVPVLLLTADGSAVRRVCDGTAVLSAGRVVAGGSLLELASAASGEAAALLLPEIPTGAVDCHGHDRAAEVVLVGFAAVGALLPEASARFGVDIAVLGGGMTRFGDTPVARFAVGVSGERADSALAFLAEHGAAVHCAVRGPQGVAA